jgi:hypothetical protein
MNELKPDTASQQWPWFGAALLAMMVITYIATSLPGDAGWAVTATGQ